MVMMLVTTTGYGRRCMMWWWLRRMLRVTLSLESFTRARWFRAPARCTGTTGTVGRVYVVVGIDGFPVFIVGIFVVAGSAGYGAGGGMDIAGF
jgi:hypothetical protein